MKEIKKGVGWKDNSGKIWTDEQVERKFDSLTKVSLKHRAKDAIEKYINQLKKFPVAPDDYLESSTPTWFESQYDKTEVRLKKASMYFDDDLVAEAISKLSEDDKELIEWLYICEYTEKTIAEWLQIREESVEKRRYRAIRRLKKSLGVKTDEEK